MKKVLLLKFGELFLKGRNRHDFISLLMKNIRLKLKNYKCLLTETQGRLILSDFDENLQDEIIEKIQQVFGLIGVAPAIEFETSMHEIEERVLQQDFENVSTFKVETKRADKTFSMNSVEMNSHIGEIILNKIPKLKVDLYHPQKVVYLEIRTGGKTYLYDKVLECAGGLPLSSAGKGLVLLSGGIDSPVAAWLMSKRGLALEAVHFHSYPYTSLQAKEKVIELAKIVSQYTGKIKLHIVSFTEIQEEIHKNCDADYMITIMRRIMMRIAQCLCVENDCGAIVTGESLGQVASQTMQSMTVTNAVVNIPVFRPVLAFDKEQIMEVARKIKTYETSILPYEDCCTVFLPKNPVIHPTLKYAEKLETKLNIDMLVQRAIETEEILMVDEY